ncbi:MAG: O-antigen polymerase [Melioribacteraceae bacterium]
MSLISLISFILCGLIIASFFRPNTDVLSPGKIFAFIWALAIGITDLKFSGLQHEWSFEVWVQVLIGPISFLIGAGIVYVLKIDSDVKTLNYLRTNRQLYEVDRSKLYRVIIILSVLFLISYTVIYLNTKEIPLFSAKPGRARANFTMFGIGLFLHNVVLIFFLTAVYFVLEKKNKFRKSILLILSLVSLVLYAITLQRFQVFLTILMIITLLYYITFRVNLKTVSLLSVFIIIFFFLVSSFRAGEVIVFVLYRMSKMRFSPDYAIFTEPYMYVTMNLENYARSIVKVENFTYGFYTFDFVTAVSGLKHWIDQYFHLNDTPFLTSSYNTYSAFWTYYRDFGILGIFFIPLFGGMALSSLYYSFRAKPTLQKLAIYGMFLFAIIFSFFNSVIESLWFVYNLIVLILVFQYISIGKPIEIY